MKPRRRLPPSGAPIYIRDLLSGVLGILRPAKALKKFEEELRAYFRVKHVFLVSSGKAALTLILQALHEMTGGDEVVLPSYTCFSVPSAVVRAGFKPVICDIEGNDFNYDIEHLTEAVGKDTLCVLATHLFGIPCDLDPILSVTRSAGNCVVEDCAQAMGAELGGKKVGAIGDVGFFSLGRGKNLSAVSGGIIITDNDNLGKLIAREYSALRMPGVVEQVRSLCIALFLCIFSRPSLYWIPAGLPFLGIGETVFSTDFSVTKLAGFNAGLATHWKSKLEAFNHARRERAETYKRMLRNDELAFLPETEGSVPVYLRFPVIAGSPAEREAVCHRLSAAGLGASTNYPSGIADIPELSLSEKEKARCQRGSCLAKRILTLPTHSQVGSQETDKIECLITDQHRYFEQEIGN